MAALSWPGTQYLQGNRRRCPPSLGSHLPLSAFLGGQRLPGKKLAHKLKKHSKVSRPKCSCPASLDARTQAGRGGPTSSLCCTLTHLFPGLSIEQHLCSTVPLCDPGLHYRDSRFENISTGSPSRLVLGLCANSLVASASIFLNGSPWHFKDKTPPGSAKGHGTLTLVLPHVVLLSHQNAALLFCIGNTGIALQLLNNKP